MIEEKVDEESGLKFSFSDESEVGEHSFTLKDSIVTLYKVKESILGTEFFVVSYLDKGSEILYGVGYTAETALIDAEQNWYMANGRDIENPFSLVLEIMHKQNS